MRIGITMFPTDRAVHPVRLGRLVEEHGFESLFLPEHTHVPIDRSSPYPSGGELPDDFARFHDPLECLSAVAAVTTTLVLGTATLVVPDHDPIMLAKRISTLDHLCGGRLVVGVGAGWNLEEMANHGADPALRFTIFRERVEAMRAIWTNEVASYEGRAVRFTPMRQWPKPVQAPHPPVYVGGAGPRLEERVLAFGDGWMASGRHLDGAALAARAENLRRLAAERGRAVPVMMQQGRAERDALHEYAAMGLERVTLRVEPGDERDVDAQLARLARIAGPWMGDSDQAGDQAGDDGGATR